MIIARISEAEKAQLSNPPHPANAWLIGAKPILPSARKSLWSAEGFAGLGEGVFLGGGSVSLSGDGVDLLVILNAKIGEVNYTKLNHS